MMEIGAQRAQAEAEEQIELAAAQAREEQWRRADQRQQAAEERAVREAVQAAIERELALIEAEKQAAQTLEAARLLEAMEAEAMEAEAMQADAINGCFEKAWVPHGIKLIFLLFIDLGFQIDGLRSQKLSRMILSIDNVFE